MLTGPSGIIQKDPKAAQRSSLVKEWVFAALQVKRMRLIGLLILLVVGLVLFQTYRNHCHFGDSYWADCILK